MFGTGLHDIAEILLKVALKHKKIKSSQTSETITCRTSLKTDVNSGAPEYIIIYAI
jgi:hypothetical protein